MAVQSSTVRRPLPTFELEAWFRRYAFEPGMVNLSPSNPPSPTLGQLLELAGMPGSVLEEISLDYPETAGSPALRAAIAGLYRNLAPDEVVVTSGALEAITLTLLCLVSAGDTVLVESPIYGAYQPVLTRLRTRVIPLPLEATAGYQHRLEHVEQLLRDEEPTLVIVNPFNNPTGHGLTSDAMLEALVELCRAHGCRLLSDEVFRAASLTGDGLASVLDLVPSTVTRFDGDRSRSPVALGDMTKAWGLGGLRIGWVACRDPELRAAVLDARDYTTNSSSCLSEQAAVIALSVRDRLLDPPLIAARVTRDAIDEYLASTGGALRWRAPAGGYCGWVEVVDVAPGAVTEACARLARERQMLLLPGAVFGPMGDRHVRIGLGAGAEALYSGLDALVDLVRKR